MDSSLAGHLIGLGLSMGVIHVLTGPDHMSALATLAVGSSWKAFWLGIRWGLGHSTGLLIIALIFLSIEGGVSLTAIESVCSWVVGIFMIALGLWNVRQVYMEFNEPVDHAHSPLLENDSLATAVVVKEQPGDVEKAVSFSEHTARTESTSQYGPMRTRSMAKSQAEIFTYDHALAHWSCLKNIDVKDPMTQRIIAFAVGIVHGIAGPGGVLGVLPAVQMHSWSKSMLYLGCFIFASTITMGIFAALYGELTTRVSDTQKMLYRLSMFSAFLCVAVGVVWIILLALGILDHVFE